MQFWFDLLNKFIVVRSTVKPKEKSPEEKSKDKCRKSGLCSATAPGLGRPMCFDRI